MRREKCRNQGLNTNTNRVGVGLSKERPRSLEFTAREVGLEMSRRVFASPTFIWGVSWQCLHLEGNWLLARLKGERMEAERQ